MNEKSKPTVAETSVAEISGHLGCTFSGDGKVRLRGFASLESAGPGDLVFITDEKYKTRLEKSRASAAVVPKDMDIKIEGLPVIYAENPYLAFNKAVSLFFAPVRPSKGIHPSSHVSPSAKIGRGVTIGPLSYIGDEVEIGEDVVIFPLAAVYPRARIGPGTILHSHVSIREDVVIGRRVIIHSGAVIGSDGFGYIQDEKGSHIKIPQAGRVIIEDDVEIGANTTIDRAALDSTVIKKGTKIDNLVMIAHNVSVGRHTILAAQTGIAGSSTIGDHVIAAGQVGIADHLNIGDKVVLAAKTGVSNSVPPGAMVSGSPHLDIRIWRKAWASIPKLYDLIKEFRRLKKRVEELEAKISKE